MAQASAPSRMFVVDRFTKWLAEPQHPLRIEIIRIFAPFAVTMFMVPRVLHADEWLGQSGFRVPELATADVRQPLYIGALPDNVAWVVGIALLAAGACLTVGFKTRWSAIAFALLGAFCALSDRLAAFSVSKLGPTIALTLALSSAGTHLSVDKLLAKKAGRSPRFVARTSGAIRFFQLLLPTIYCASGIAKLRGDWAKHPYVLWTHLHDTYQTSFTLLLANLMPAPGWTLLQVATLVFETAAPLWFVWKKARVPAVLWAVSMHAMIGLMFGPVRWFGLLMISLVVGAYLPERLLEKLAAKLGLAT